MDAIAGDGAARVAAAEGGIVDRAVELDRPGGLNGGMPVGPGYLSILHGRAHLGRSTVHENGVRPAGRFGVAHHVDGAGLEGVAALPD